jgi:hypothetical protein
MSDEFVAASKSAAFLEKFAPNSRQSQISAGEQRHQAAMIMDKVGSRYGAAPFML